MPAYKNVLLGLALALLILVVGHFGFHPAEGAPRALLFAGAAAAFCVCAFVLRPGKK